MAYRLQQLASTRHTAPALFRWAASGNSIISLRQKSTSSEDESYQYLQRSKIPTLHFQSSLPRLPIPHLDKTCERYLQSLEPIVSPDDLEKTRSIVKDFQEGQGKKLHQQLKHENVTNRHTSYISKPWFDMYLSSRVPLPLNYNPFLAWRRDPDEAYNDQLVRAANIVVSSLRFRKSLQEHVLEPQVFHLNPAKSNSQFYRDLMSMLPGSVAWYPSALLFKAYPLDMSQFNNLFNTSRIPQQGKDVLLYEPTKKHMVVLRQGNFYSFDVTNENGTIVSPQAVFANLSTILQRNDPPAATALGAFTTMERDEWATVRSHLTETGNSDQLNLIDSAVMLLVLDDEHFDIPRQRIEMAHHCLHGPALNRWFDKSISVIVTRCGNACVNFEHSWGDGVAVLRYFNEVHSDSTTNHQCHPNDEVKTNLVTVKKLEFNIDKSTEDNAKKAVAQYDSLRNSLTLSAVEHEGVTREFIKNQRLSPDAIFQLSFQLGFYKLNKFTPPSYESCSTSAFLHGRTETVRPATTQTKKCVEAICSGNASPDEIRALIDEASQVHNQLTKRAAMGQGFDRHLFALKELAIRNGEKVHSLYEDPVFVRNNTFLLSTSTLHGEAFIAGGFAPVEKAGYGLGYGMPERNFGTLVSAYKTHADGEGLARCLKEGLDQIVDILLKCKPPSK